MRDVALETIGLTKIYGSRRGVEGLSLRVPQGAVFGFLGPNGAGKTTTIRMLLGLTFPTEGRIRVLGQELTRMRPHLRKAKVGALLENPGFYPMLSARKNLAVLARCAGDPDAFPRIPRLLERVGLADRAQDRVSSFSFGMRQRLGLAAALLHQPDLVILDEPTSGMDPSGIRDIRTLLLDLQRGGATVFLSSHLLSEVEALCDEIAIINRGRLAIQGPIREFQGQIATRVVVDDSPAAMSALRAQDWQVVLDGDQVLVMDREGQEVNAALSAAGIAAREVRPVRKTLEELFVNFTSGDDL